MNGADVMAIRVRMHDTAWFGSGPAFWRWVCTREATPYLVAFASLKHDKKTSPLLERERLAELARRIEADYGDKREPARAKQR